MYYYKSYQTTLIPSTKNYPHSDAVSYNLRLIEDKAKVKSERQKPKQSVTHQLKWIPAISYLAYHQHYIVHLLTVLPEANSGPQFQTHYLIQT